MVNIFSAEAITQSIALQVNHKYVTGYVWNLDGVVDLWSGGPATSHQ